MICQLAPFCYIYLYQVAGFIYIVGVIWPPICFANSISICKLICGISLPAPMSEVNLVISKNSFSPE